MQETFQYSIAALITPEKRLKNEYSTNKQVHRSGNLQKNPERFLYT